MPEKSLEEILENYSAKLIRIIRLESNVEIAIEKANILQKQAAQAIKDYIDKEIKKISGKNEWLHKCSDGQIRPYASVLCSMCRDGVDVGVSNEYLKKLGYVKLAKLPKEKCAYQNGELCNDTARGIIPSGWIGFDQAIAEMNKAIEEG